MLSVYGIRLRSSKAMLAITMSLSTNLAIAQETILSAGDLYTACTTAEPAWVDFCNGYMQAANDLAVLTETACVPVGTTRSELAEVYQLRAGEVLSAAPELVDDPAIDVATYVLGQVFPCE